MKTLWVEWETSSPPVSTVSSFTLPAELQVKSDKEKLSYLADQCKPINIEKLQEEVKWLELY